MRTLPSLSRLVCAALTALLVVAGPGCGVIAGISIGVIQSSGSSGGSSGVPAPVVQSVTPATVSHGGGETITITGFNFPPDATVSVGGVAATAVAVQDGGRLTCVTPRLSAIGPQAVVVTNPGGGSGTLQGGVSTTNQVPTAVLAALSGNLSQNVVVSFTLSDPESDPVDIRFEVDNGTGVFSPVPANLIVGGSLTNLPTSPQGVLTNITWNSNGSFPSQNAANVRVRVVPVDRIDSQAGAAGTSAALSILNNTPVGVTLVQPGNDAFNVVISYRVTDPNPQDPLQVTALTWTDLGTGASGSMTVAGGQGVGSVPFSASGTLVSTIWNSLADLSFGNNRLLQVAVTVSDGSNSATSTSAPFFVSNGPLADQQVNDALVDVQGFVLADVLGNDGRPDIVTADTNTPFSANLNGQISAAQNRGQDFANSTASQLPAVPGAPAGPSSNFFLDDLPHPSELEAIDENGDGRLDLIAANSVYGPYTTLELLQNTTSALTNAGANPAAFAAHQVLYKVNQSAAGALNLAGGTYESVLVPIGLANEVPTHGTTQNLVAPAFPNLGGFVQDLVAAELDPSGSGSGNDLLILHGIANLSSASGGDVRGALTVRKRGPGGLQAAPGRYFDPRVMGALPVHAAVADLTSNAHTGGFPVAPTGAVPAGLPDVLVACAGDNSLTFYIQTAAAGAPDTTPGTFHGVKVSLASLYTQVGASGVPAGDVRGVAIGDLNGDGANDFVVVHQLSRLCLVFVYDPGSGGPLSLNSSNASYIPGSFPAGLLPFRLALAWQLPSIQCGRPAIKDVTGDGRPDLLVPQRLGNEVLVYTNRGNQAAQAGLGQSTPTPLFGPGGTPLPPAPSPFSFTTSFQPFEVTVQDVNGDRRDDVITPCGLSFDVSVFLQTTPGSLDRFIPVPAGGSPFLMETGDLTQDGAPDLAVTMNNDNAVFVFQRASGGSLLSRTHSFDVDGPTGVRTDPLTGSTTTPSTPFGVSVKDATGDGRPDIIAAVQVLTQVSPSGATRGGLIMIPGGPLAADIALVRSSSFAPIGFDPDAGDVIGPGGPDGIPDLVLSTNQGTGFNIYQGLGNGTFANVPVSVNAGSGTQVTVVDLNGDGFQDIVCGSGNFTVGTRVFYGRSDGATPAASVNIQDNALGNPVGLFVADVGGPLDSMGQPMLDVIVTGFTLQSGGIFFQTNPGSRTPPDMGGFVAPTFVGVPLTVGGEPAQVAVGDLNSDGLADLAIPWGRDNLLAVYYRNPSPTGLSDTFFGPALFPTANSPIGCAILDVDGDGRNDVVVSARGANALNVFLQR